MPLSNVTGAASLSRPGVCTSTTRPASPYDGQMIYETDTDRVAAYNGSAWVYLTGTTFVNWTSYTPIIKGGTTTVSATITYAKYARVGNMAYVQVLATVTSAGATNGAITIGVPIGLEPSTLDVRLVRGNFFLDDAGVGIYSGNAIVSNSYGSHTAVAGFGAGAVVDVIGANGPAITLANTDRVGCNVVYEVA